MGRRADALAAIQAAVDIRRPLAETAADAYLPDLATLLTAPDAYLPNLATSLTNLALFQSQENCLQDALANASEAVSIYCALADAQPDVFLGDLGDALDLAFAILDEFEDSEHELVRRELEEVEQRLRD